MAKGGAYKKPLDMLEFLKKVSMTITTNWELDKSTILTSMSIWKIRLAFWDLSSNRKNQFVNQMVEM